jgi:hypothetical protein
MKDFLILIRGGHDRMEDLNEEERNAHMQKWGAFMGKLTESGNLAGGLPLTTDGKLLTKDGASNDLVSSTTGEVVGGYLLLKANDYDHAVELSKACPVFEHNGNLEIREAMQMG